MEKKNLIIITALLIIIFILCGALVSALTQTQYEKIEVVSNGTTMEVPTNNLTNLGDPLEDGCKMWRFEQGGVISFNTIEVENTKDESAYEDGADELNEVIRPVLNDYEKKEEIDGYTVYTMKGESVNAGDGKTIYVIMHQNEETGDNIVIMTDNKDITLHIAKSIEYKMGNIPIKHSTTVNTKNYDNKGEWVEIDPTVPITKYNDGSAFHEEDLNDYYRKTGQEYRIKNDN